MLFALICITILLTIVGGVIAFEMENKGLMCISLISTAIITVTLTNCIQPVAELQQTKDINQVTTPNIKQITVPIDGTESEIHIIIQRKPTQGNSKMSDKNITISQENMDIARLLWYANCRLRGNTCSLTSVRNSVIETPFVKNIIKTLLSVNHILGGEKYVELEVVNNININGDTLIQGLGDLEAAVLKVYDNSYIAQPAADYITHKSLDSSDKNYHDMAIVSIAAHKGRNMIVAIYDRSYTPITSPYKDYVVSPEVSDMIDILSHYFKITMGYYVAMT